MIYEHTSYKICYIILFFVAVHMPVAVPLILQRGVGVVAAAVMKTGSDMSYSMTSLLSHHARALLWLLPH